jgi:hypothetical protein
MRLIDTHEIESWGGSRSAQGDLPRLVKDLISAVIEPEKLRFPSGDAIWVPGADGVLVTTEKHRFVPYGQSVWEVGTNSDFKAKANSDYRKRSRKIARKGKEGRRRRIRIASNSPSSL